MRRASAGVLVAGVIAAILFWRSDWFQRAVFPQNYWDQRIAELEGSIRTEEFVLRDLRLELAKRLQTVRLDMAQEANIGRAVGLQPGESAKEAVGTVRDRITTLRALIGSSEEALGQTRAELDRARSEQARHG
jgi:hypothetical protein